MATDVERLFHETWLGETQPHEGLTFSVPVLCDGGVMQRLDVARARAFVELTTERGPRRALPQLRACLLEFFGWNEDELHGPDRMPDDLLLRVAEEGTELRPTLAIPYGQKPDPKPGSDAPEPPRESGEHTPASRAGAAYQLLVWELPTGLDLDAPEAETTQWHYPPSAKFERLLRETRVPMGLLSNGETLRLLYCPTGQSTGWISFDVTYMCSASGRDMLSALRELLHADRVLGGMPDTPTTLELLQLSRERQADVSTRLGEQALDALQILLEGFEAAAHRDGDEVLREAMRMDGNHVYEGLLTVVLRLIFALYAEDLDLLPVEHPVYARHLGVSGLYDDLVADADAYGDTMDQRFGAWPRLIMLFRALYFGVELGSGPQALSMPPHRGHLFNPENYPFLEGWIGGGAPVSPEDRAATRLPSIADGVVYRVLQRLLFLDGQRLSYSALETEQLGSAYESLMGYAVERRMAWSVCLAPSRVWVSPRDLLDQPRATRTRWLQDAGVTAAAAKRLVSAVEELEDRHAGSELDAEVLAKLREFSVTPSRKRGSRDALSSRAEVGPDRLVIQPGEERRRTSSHYTPSSLSGPIVARTLEPLLAAIRARVAHEHPELTDLDGGPQPRAADLLNLKICDPAMGSGAFLVESCRFLARQLVAAWVREGTLEQEIAKAGDEAARRKPEQLAMRVVAQRCLYGVDKNPLAVELGKLSLWLLTLARGQTFTFLDHCLKAGDSLVGLSKAQILAMDWSPAVAKPVKAAKPSKTSKKKSARKQPDDPQAQLNLFLDQTKRAFDKATLARQKLAELAARGDRADVEQAQHELHVQAEQALERVRDVADILLSSYFWPFDDANKLTPEFLFSGEKVSDKARQECLVRVRDELNFWLMGADSPRLPRRLDVRRALVRECIRPMHWEVEFPEVFADERRDSLSDEGVGNVWMDAVVGNPPFMGGKTISSNLGLSYLEWLGQAHSSNKNADISAFFVRRSLEILGAHGTLGLITTNTISQGDTHAAGLQAAVSRGAVIYNATTSMKWPQKGANVSISVVHMALGAPIPKKALLLDGVSVLHINSQLRPAAERNTPSRISANKNKSHIGSYILGPGFVLTPEERDELVGRDKLAAHYIYPFLGGQELNTSPTHAHHRYIINLGTLSLQDAEKQPLLMAVVREKVKPSRDLAKRPAYRNNWWQFAEKQLSLYAAIKPLARCLACSSVSKHSVFAFQPTDRVFSHALVIFALSAYAHFGLLQSRIHELWARLHGSSMRNDLRYTPSDCFETFPFPDERTLAEDSPLEAIAKQLYETRAAYMVDTDQGLTKTYNALKDPNNTDPAIEHLRQLHEQLDRAVLDAYDQPGIVVPPYAHASAEALERFEDAVLDFLFARNQKLAKLEAQQRGKAGN